MSTFRRKWIAFSLLSGCAIAVSGLASAVEAGARPDLPAQGYPAAQAQRQESPAVFQNWIAVDSTVLDEMRGGFDIAPGLKVSFGIERMVNLNGVLQTATRIEVPDAGKLLQAQQSSAMAPLSGASNPASSPATLPGSSASSGNAVSSDAGGAGSAIALPLATNLGNGAAALIQNGLGNTFAQSALSPEAAATIIQNSANNQTIQSLTVINAATNSLELLKDANLQSTLLDALTQSTGAR